MMMTRSRLLTVILNWRTPDMTLEAAAAAVREMEGIPGEIVIVDNASGDGSLEKIEAGVAAAGWDRVRVVASPRNGGYGAGNNVGIRAGLSGGSRPDYVYILNSDAFPDKDAIRYLVGYLDTHPKVGFAGSYIHGTDGEPHCTAFRFPSVWSELEGAARFGPLTRLLANHVVPLPIPERTGEVDWLAGASVMMRQRALDKIGLFDERYFLYFDETDLCRRARAAGFPIVYVRESSVTHLGSVSTGMKEWQRTPSYWFDSRLRYFVKNHGPGTAVAATLAHLLGGSLWRVRAFIQRKPVGDPPGFLNDLTAHAARAVFASLRPRAGSSPGGPAEAKG